MANFDIAIKHTLFFEGEYSNHRLDRGGSTMYGITEKVARENGYNGDMKDLPLSKARNIYFVNYWQPLRLNEMYSQEVANELFDTAVNMGVRTSGKFLQESINMLDNADLKIDGIIGPKTMQSVLIFLNKSEHNAKALYKCLNGLQFCKYKKIIMLNPKQKVFFKGWLKRV